MDIYIYQKQLERVMRVYTVMARNKTHPTGKRTYKVNFGVINCML